jgi:crotonobetainyl-CoA:carnitine CoA-transferase CaiB-like acyl-CoA transferase
VSDDEAIKIETPGTGDVTCTLMPLIVQANSLNKRSFAVRLKAAGGVGRVKRIAATSDLLGQSMRPGAARALGLLREEIAAVNPKASEVLPAVREKLAG